ncbi:MAG: AMP-binding protein [Streptosporangiales bacterium]|nr:AMP-binding protein [Streptosporangiales bacterium]
MDEVDVRGVRVRTWKHAPGSIRDMLEISKFHGDKDFLIYEDERVTFERHYAIAATLAHRLVEDFGVAKGDRIALAMRNFPEWPAVFFAATAIGAVVVPLNAWWTAQELEFGLTDSGARLVFADGERADRLREVLPRLGIATVVVRPEGELPEGARTFTEVLGDVATDAALPPAEVHADDDATIFYTSGTTGKPKGALGTHRNFCGNPLGLAYLTLSGAMRGGASMEQAAGAIGERRVTLLGVPLFHATGCHAVLSTTVFSAGGLVLMYKWDAQRALELIQRERITLVSGVPTMALQLLSHPDFDSYDLSSLTAVSYGGAPAPPMLAERIKEVLPNRTPSNGYGLTETSATTTYNSGYDYVRKPESVGPPMAVSDVKVVDPAGTELPMGEVGELLIKGPNVIMGYWNRPDATANTFVDGWLHTGDLAKLDDEGFVHIVDRAKDMVIRGGENVYCAEVEGAMYEHPAVADCAVIGIPHDVLGEEVGAVVCRAPGASLTEDELRDFLKTHLAPFKIPVRVWFREGELPRNPGGKILKTRLRDELLG